MEHPSLDFKRHCIGTDLEFLFLPRRCCLTDKLLWLTKAYKQTAIWTGPGDNLFEYRYYNKKDFLVARLKDLV